MAGERLPTKLKGWRRIANAMWSAPSDPQIYGALEIEATALRAFMRACEANGAGNKITPTHLVGRAIAHVLREVPELNVRIRGGWAYPRESVDVFFITAVEGGTDLSGVKIKRADEKSAVEIASELRERASRLRAGDDPELAKSKQVTDRLPMPLLRVMLRFATWVTGDLDRSVRALGLARSPFGSAAITSVGMFGLPIGFAPISWIHNIPLLVLVGALEDKAVVVDGKVEVRPVLPITATIDHRFVDGFHIARMMKALRAYLAAPERFEPRAPAEPLESDAMTGGATGEAARPS